MIGSRGVRLFEGTLKSVAKKRCTPFATRSSEVPGNFHFIAKPQPCPPAEVKQPKGWLLLDRREPVWSSPWAEFTDIWERRRIIIVSLLALPSTKRPWWSISQQKYSSWLEMPLATTRDLESSLATFCWQSRTTMNCTRFVFHHHVLRSFARFFPLLPSLCELFEIILPAKSKYNYPYFIYSLIFRYFQWFLRILLLFCIKDDRIRKPSLCVYFTKFWSFVCSRAKFQTWRPARQIMWQHLHVIFGWKFHELTSH